MALAGCRLLRRDTESCHFHSIRSDPHCHFLSAFYQAFVPETAVCGDAESRGLDTDSEPLVFCAFSGYGAEGPAYV